MTEETATETRIEQLVDIQYTKHHQNTYPNYELKL